MINWIWTPLSIYWLRIDISVWSRQWLYSLVQADCGHDLQIAYYLGYNPAQSTNPLPSRFAHRASSTISCSSGCMAYRVAMSFCGFGILKTEINNIIILGTRLPVMNMQHLYLLFGGCWIFDVAPSLLSKTPSLSSTDQKTNHY